MDSYVPWSKVAFYWGWETSHLLIGILIMGPYKPLRTWVDDHPLPYGNVMGVDFSPIALEKIPTTGL